MVAEARSADEPVLTRRCVIMKVPDFNTERYLEAQRQNAAAIMILLPKNISSISHETVQVYQVILIFLLQDMLQGNKERNHSIFSDPSDRILSIISHI